MRHLKSDLSHRMRRRSSAPAARWLRIALGLALSTLVGLVMGPPVAGWLRGDLAHEPVAIPTTPAESEPRQALLVKPPSAAPLVAARATGPDTKPVGGKPGAQPAPVAARSSSSGAEPLPVYRVQLGAFLDHRNADRLVESLRNADLEVVSRVVEQSRVLYRVLAEPASDHQHENFLHELRAAGFTPEPTAEGIVVLAPSPLHTAVETSRRLKEAGIGVRLVKTLTTSPFRVVRVGRFTSLDEAERSRADLASRGLTGGFVVRE